MSDFNENKDFVEDVNTEFETKRKINRQKHIWSEFWQWTQAILIAVIIAYLINVFVFERAYVDGTSMMPTLNNGESLFEYKLGYYFGEPKRGDIIVFTYQPGKYSSKFNPFPDPTEKDYIKRIIALPGETIDIKDGKVYIDGKRLDEPYIKTNAEDEVDTLPISNGSANITYPYKVPDGHVFVLGDNRGGSQDSRDFGPVDTKKIRGKAVAVLVPLNKFRVLKFEERFLEN